MQPFAHDGQVRAPESARGYGIAEVEISGFRGRSRADGRQRSRRSPSGAAYGIPVGFQTVMRVVGGNSLTNIASLTPGGVGVSQAFNVASLHDVTSAATASAYSVRQQLLTTVWNVVLAIVLVVAAFGWSGGRQLVEQSCGGAKTKLRERSS